MMDGHDFDAMFASFAAARADTERPSCIIANTTPGKGVPFLEGQKSHNMVLPDNTAGDALKWLEADHG